MSEPRLANDSQTTSPAGVETSQRDPHLRPSTVIELPASIAEDAEALQHLRDNVDATRALMNPHLSTVTAIEQQDGRVLLKRPALQGRNLEQLVRQRRLTTEQALEIAAQTADALAALHHADLVHGGVVAEDVVVMPRGTVRLRNAGLFELYRREPPAELQDVYAEPATSDAENGRKADIRGLTLVLLYALLGGEGEGQSFTAFARQVDAQGTTGVSLRRRLRNLEPALRICLEELLEAPPSRLLDVDAARQIAEKLRALIPQPVNLKPLGTAGLMNGGSTTHKEPITQARNEARGVVLGLMLLLTFVMGAFFALSLATPVVPHRNDKNIVEMLTLPGKNGTWWAEDPHTYWMLPTMRAAMARDGVSLRSVATSDAAKQTRNGAVTGAGTHDAYRDADVCWSVLDPQKNDASLPKDWRQTRETLEEYKDVFPALAPADPATSYTLEAALDSIQGSDGPSLHTRAIVLHRLVSVRASETTARAAASNEADGESDAEPADGSEQSGAADRPAAKSASAAPSAVSSPFQQAEDAYRDALHEYQRHPWHDLELLALCHADYANLLVTQRSRWNDATEHLMRARELVDQRETSTPWTARELEALEKHIPAARDETADTQGSAQSQAEVQPTSAASPDLTDLIKSTETPGVPFLIDCYCREAQAYRSAGHWSTALQRTNEALRLAFSDKASLALRAHALERAAWLYTDLWKLDYARSCFSVAADVRQSPDHFPEAGCVRSCETFLLVQHDRHGEAMVERYSGRGSAARRYYQRIIAELENKVSHHESKELRTFEREQREARLLNSLQRYVDSHVYDPELLLRPDLRARARRAIDKALNEVRRLSVLESSKAEGESLLLGQLVFVELADDELADGELGDGELGESDRLNAARRALALAEEASTRTESRQRPFIVDVAKDYLEFVASSVPATPPPAVQTALAETTMDNGTPGSTGGETLANGTRSAATVSGTPAKADSATTNAASRPLPTLLTSLETHVAAKGEGFGRDDLDVVLLVARMVAHRLTASDDRAPQDGLGSVLDEDAFSQSRRQLAFLLHAMLRAPRQRQVNAGLVKVEPEQGENKQAPEQKEKEASPLKEYFDAPYRDIVALLPGPPESENVRIRQAMANEDAEFKRYEPTLTNVAPQTESPPSQTP